MKVVLKFFLALIISITLASNMFAQESIWENYYQTARTQLEKGNYKEAEQYFRFSISEAGNLVEKKQETSSFNKLTLSMCGLIVAFEKQAKLSEAEEASRTLLSFLKTFKPENDREFLIALNNLGLILSEEEKYEEAEAIHRKVLSVREKYLGLDSIDVAISLINIGKIKFDQNKIIEAEAIFNKSFKILLKIPAQEIDLVYCDCLTVCMNNLAYIYISQKKYLAADNCYKFIIDIVIKVKGEKHPDLILIFEDYINLLKVMQRDKDILLIEKRIEKIKAN